MEAAPPALRRAARALGCLAALTALSVHVEDAAGRGDAAAFLGADGALRAPVELRDAQEGFAGQTGTLWTIEPDGAYRVARFVAQVVQPAHRTGQLTRAELARLAQVLAAQDLLSLPDTVGSLPPVNPRRISVRFGSRVSTLVLAPGEEPREAAARGTPGSPATRLVAIREAIRTLVPGDERP
jgi:hypothetical protein